jgi:cytochrome b involved in lipid metabolism
MPGGRDEVREPTDSVQSDPGVRKFTWQELSKLNERHNVHVAVRGKVYDVSSFIEKHPGGVDQLLLGAGRDVTILFESYHNFNVSK